MGCCDSKDDASDRTEIEPRKSEPEDGDGITTVDKHRTRRRLSVGTMDAAAFTEEDRGAIMALSEENLLALVDAAAVHGTPPERKGSIGSTTDKGRRNSFTEKTVTVLGDEIVAGSSGLGWTCVKGLKPESPNQDSWSILSVDGDFSIYAVYDGHGAKGHDVSHIVKENLFKLIVGDQRFRLQGSLPQVLKDAFKRMQAMLAFSCPAEVQHSGTTATVVVHEHQAKQITVAHVGDSTAVLCRGSGEAIKGSAVTRDHRPDLPDERARVEKAGGRVVFDGFVNYRIYAANAHYPGLNMSRSLGDTLGQDQAGVTCEPEILVRKVEQDDQFLLLCSDGIWEFIQPQEAVELVHGFAKNEASAACGKLAKSAYDRWIKEEGDVVDDITVLLVHLHVVGSSGQFAATDAKLGS